MSASVAADRLVLVRRALEATGARPVESRYKDRGVSAYLTEGRVTPRSNATARFSPFLRVNASVSSRVLSATTNCRSAAPAESWYFRRSPGFTRIEKLPLASVVPLATTAVSTRWPSLSLLSVAALGQATATTVAPATGIPSFVTTPVRRRSSYGAAEAPIIDALVMPMAVAATTAATAILSFTLPPIPYCSGKSEEALTVVAHIAAVSMVSAQRIKMAVGPSAWVRLTTVTPSRHACLV